MDPNPLRTMTMEFAPTILTEIFESNDDALEKAQEMIYESAVISEHGSLIRHTILMPHEDYPDEKVLVDVEGRAWAPYAAPSVERMEFTCAKAMLPIGKAFNTFRLGQKWAKKLKFGDAVEIAPHGLKATVLGVSCLRGEQAAAQALENLTTLSLQAKYGLTEDAALAGFFKEIREIYSADPITEKNSEWSVVWLYIPEEERG